MTRIHYCDACRDKRTWPESDVIREVRCSICHELDTCYINDTAKLPQVKVNDLPNAPQKTEPVSTDIDSDFPKLIKRPVRKQIPKIEKVKGPVQFDMEEDVKEKSMPLIESAEVLKTSNKENPSAKDANKIDYLSMTAESIRKIKALKNKEQVDDKLEYILEKVFSVCTETESLVWETQNVSAVIVNEIIDRMTEKGFEVTKKDEVGMGPPYLTFKW